MNKQEFTATFLKVLPAYKDGTLEVDPTTAALMEVLREGLTSEENAVIIGNLIRWGLKYDPVRVFINGMLFGVAISSGSFRTKPTEPQQELDVNDIMAQLDELFKRKDA